MYKILILLALSVSAYAKPVVPTVPASHVLYEYETHSYYVKENVDQVRPIASITKLFTAITVIRSGVNLDEKVKVQGKTYGHFPRNTMPSRIDLLRAVMISSDNLAAESLAMAHPGGYDQFLTDVNLYIKSLKLKNTVIVDPTGLGIGNVSTVNDLIEVLTNIKNNPVIKNISNEKHAKIQVAKGKKTITINLNNTNPQIFVYNNILISKTGFTNPAGRCLALLIEKNGIQFAVIILGQKDVRARSKIVDMLMSVPVLPREPEPPTPAVVVDYNMFF